MIDDLSFTVFLGLLLIEMEVFASFCGIVVLDGVARIAMGREGSEKRRWNPGSGKSGGGLRSNQALPYHWLLWSRGLPPTRASSRAGGLWLWEAGHPEGPGWVPLARGGRPGGPRHCQTWGPRVQLQYEIWEPGRRRASRELSGCA